MNAIAIDDEPKALEIIQSHAEKISFLNLRKTFREALSAIEWLQNNQVDVVFLDINMPHLSGLKFKSLVNQELMIIFTTAYSEFAVESYEQDAIDYLLKPIQFPRFFKSVVKARKILELKNNKTNTNQKITSTAIENSIYIKSGNKKYKINSTEILFLQKDGNYIYFHLRDKKIISRMNMQQALDLLPTGQFIRIHKSWIVSIHHIEVIQTSQVIIKSQPIPIGKRFEKEIKKLRL